MQILGTFINEILPDTLPVTQSIVVINLPTQGEAQTSPELAKLCMLCSQQPETHFEMEYPSSFAGFRQLTIIVSL
jgi:hypothetical protein